MHNDLCKPAAHSDFKESLFFLLFTQRQAIYVKKMQEIKYTKKNTILPKVFTYSSKSLNSGIPITPMATGV